MSKELDNLYKLYEENEKFKEYVDKYRKHHDLLLVEALQHELVKEYARDVLEINIQQDWRMLR